MLVENQGPHFMVFPRNTIVISFLLCSRGFARYLDVSQLCVYKFIVGCLRVKYICQKEQMCVKNEFLRLHVDAISLPQFCVYN